MSNNNKIVNQSELEELNVIDGFSEVKDASTNAASAGRAAAVYEDDDAKRVLDISDVIIPTLKLAQGQTQEVQKGSAKPGDWLMLGMEPQTAVYAVPIKVAKTRTFRTDEQGKPDKNGTIACSSGDSIVGQGTPGGKCQDCPFTQWSGSEGKRVAPACEFSYEYQVIVFDFNMRPVGLARMSFSRTAIDAGRVINTMILQRGLGKVAVRFTAQSKTSPDGKKKWFSPVVSPVSMTPEMAADVEEICGK